VTSRVAAAAVVGVEGVGAIATGLTFLTAALVAHPEDRGTAALLGGLLALYGAGIVAVSRGLLRDRRWARTPAFLTQFFALVVAWYQRGTVIAVTASVGAVAVVAIVCLVLAVRAAEE